MENNQCFYCEIKGHRIKDCQKKAADRRNFNGGQSDKNARGPPPIHNRVSNTDTPTPDMTPTDISTFLKENMGLLDEDTKLSIVESLMPKDFSQSPKLAAIVRAFRLDSVFVNKSNSIQVKISLSHY